MTTYLENIKEYIMFTDEDTALLRALCPLAEPFFVGFSEHFYERITQHPDAHKVFNGPEQIERLKRTLVEWMRSGLLGPHDEVFYERRARIGRMHVRISLPQEYMFTAMNVMRIDFHRLIDRIYEGEGRKQRATHDALDRLFDMELAIMLQTYQQDSEERLRRNERLATIGQIAASIGHDLRNPLSVIQSSLFILRKRAAEDARTARHLQRIEGQIELCDSIISNLLQLARNQPPRRARVDLAEMFRQSMQGMSMPDTITAEIHIDPAVQLFADPALLRQALTNLITNAVQTYDNQPGTIYLSARTDGKESVVIEVADDGPGFDSDTLLRAFEPLVTTRVSGTGLGLALVKGVTERHGGTVEALNRPGGGAAIRMRLPRGSENT